MTDYLSISGNNRKEKGERTYKKSKNLLIIFLAIVLSFAAINGVFKFFDLVHFFSNGKWDSSASFPIAILDSKSLFIFQNDPKRAVVIKAENIKGDVIGSGEAAVKFLSSKLGIPVSSFFSSSDSRNKSNEEISKTYENFTSIATPIKILTTGWGDGEVNTNVSRIDALRLWWQLKDVGVNKLTFKNLDFSESKNPGVLGASTEGLNREVSQYMENLKIVSENPTINIVNSSGKVGASSLASKFVTSVGGSVGSINGDTNVLEKCLVVSSSQSYSAAYLAKIFNCDIKDASFEAESGEITILLGKNFTDKYMP